jgi:hypothetical protein
MSDTFTTQDLYVAAACVIAGHPVTVVRLDSGRNRFEFAATAAEAALAYELGSTGPLLVFANALRRLKKQMHNTPATQPSGEVPSNVNAHRK